MLKCFGRRSNVRFSNTQQQPQIESHKITVGQCETTTRSDYSLAVSILRIMLAVTAGVNGAAIAHHPFPDIMATQTSDVSFIPPVVPVSPKTYLHHKRTRVACENTTTFISSFFLVHHNIVEMQRTN